MTREYAKVPSTSLVQYMRDESITTMQMAEAMGVTPSGITGWVRKGQMSKMALVALEGIKRRNGAQPRPQIYVTTVKTETLAAFEQFCKAVGVELAKVKVEL